MSVCVLISLDSDGNYDGDVAATTSTASVSDQPMLSQPSTSDENPADLLFGAGDLQG